MNHHAWIDEKALDIAKQVLAGREESSQVLAWMQLAAIEALKLGLSGVGAYGDSGGYVAGSVSFDQERECWVAEIQTTGGYEIAADVYATSEADALHKQTAVLNALSNPPTDGLALRAAAINAALCLSGFAGEGIEIEGFQAPEDAYGGITAALGIPDADDDDLRAALGHIAKQLGEQP